MTLFPLVVSNFEFIQRACAYMTLLYVNMKVCWEKLFFSILLSRHVSVLQLHSYDANEAYIKPKQSKVAWSFDLYLPPEADTERPKKRK